MSGLGQTIRQARKAKGWSLKTFSEKIGISIMTLQRIETGQVSPSVKLMIEIAYHLGRPITDFIQDKERTLIRLKGNRIKTWEQAGVQMTGVFPEGVIEEKLGLGLAELEAGREGDWESADYYKGYHLLEGQALLEFEDHKLTVKPGETVYFDARFRHRISSPKGAKAVVVFRR